MLTVLNLAAVNDRHMQPLSHLRVRQLRVLLHIERGEETSGWRKINEEDPNEHHGRNGFVMRD